MQMVQLNASINMLFEDVTTAQEKALQGDNQENSTVEMIQELKKEWIEAGNIEDQGEWKNMEVDLCAAL